MVSLKRLSFGLILLALLISFIGLGQVISKAVQSPASAKNVISFSTRWEIWLPDGSHKKIAMPSSVMSSGGFVNVYQRVEAAIAYYGGFAFATEDQMVNVYVNEELVYSLAEDRGDRLTSFNGRVWNYVDLRGKVKQGDQIRMELANFDNLILDEKEQSKYLSNVSKLESAVGEWIYSLYTNPDERNSVRLPEVFLTSKHDMFRYIFVSEALSLMIGVSLVTLGIVVSIFGFLPYRNLKSQAELKYLGIAINFAGIAIILSNGVLQLVFKDAALLEHICSSSKLLMGYSLGIYLLEGTKLQNRWIIQIEMGIIGLMVLLKASVNLFGHGTLLDMMISENWTLVFFLVINFFCFLVDGEADDRRMTPLIVGFAAALILLIFAAIQMKNTARHISVFESFAAVFLFGSMVYMELQHYSELYEDGKSLEYYQELAGRDSLTCLKNRVSFMEDLSDYQLQYQLLSVLAFDVDNLKGTNDSMGHGKGDELLQAVASVIYRSFMDIAAGCYRMSGDEFLCVFRNVEEETIRERLERFRVGAIVESQKRGFVVSASYGYAAFEPKTDNNFERILKRGDENLYAQKREKKRQRLPQWKDILQAAGKKLK